MKKYKYYLITFLAIFNNDVVLRAPKIDFNGRRNSVVRKESNMLWTICVILLILWLLGFLTGYTMGGVIHVLLVIAIIVLVVRLIQGRKIL
jgi:amino acid transporter